MKFSGIFFLAFAVACARASKCPEPRKPHPTSCSIFYNCINLPGGGYVWIPAKCSEGLMFQPYLRICVLPGDSWTCDILATESPQMIKKQQSPDLTNPAGGSYVTLSESTPEFSEPIDSSYTVEEYPEITDHETTVTPYPLIKVTESAAQSSSIGNTIHNIGLPIAIKHSEDNYLYNFINGDRVLSTAGYANNEQLREHLERLTQLIDKLIAYQGAGTTTSTTTERPLTNDRYPLDNRETAILNLLVKNYLLKAELDASTTTTTTLETTTPNVPTTVAEDASYDSVVLSDEETTDGEISDIIINGAEASNNIIVVVDSLANKQYFTMEKYKSIAKQLQSETVELLPCTSGVRLANSTDCTKYYSCNPTTAAVIQFSCPPNTAFNAYKRICDMNEYSICMAELSKSPLTISLTTSQPNAKDTLRDGIPGKNPCQAIGKYGDPTSEKHYYLCFSVGKSKEIQYQRMSCPNGLKFCQPKNICTTKRRCYN